MDKWSGNKRVPQIRNARSLVLYHTNNQLCFKDNRRGCRLFDCAHLLCHAEVPWNFVSKPLTPASLSPPVSKYSVCTRVDNITWPRFEIKLLFQHGHATFCLTAKREEGELNAQMKRQFNSDPCCRVRPGLPSLRQREERIVQNAACGHMWFT